MSYQKRDNKTSVEVSILGENLVVTGHTSEDYIKSVAEFVNNKMSELQFNYPRMPRNKIIVLGAMNLADELFKSSQEVERLHEEVKQLRKEKDDLQKERDRLLKALEEAEDKIQHYKSEYEELMSLLNEAG